DDDGDGRVHEGVGGDLGDGHVLQQVGVGGESDDGADDGEEGDGGEAGGGPVRGAQVSACEGEQDVNDAGGADLPCGGDEGVHAEAEAAGEDGADGEDQSGDDEDGIAGDGGAIRGGGAYSAQRGRHEDEHSGGSGEHADPAARGEALARGQDGFDHRDVNGDHGDDER